MRRLLRSDKGMTLIELIVALVLGSILAVMAIGAFFAAYRLYSNSKTISEGGTVKSTLYEAVTDELRYATEVNVEREGTVITFISPIHGNREVEMRLGDDGYLKLFVEGEDPKDIISKKAYLDYKISNVQFKPESIPGKNPHYVNVVISIPSIREVGGVITEIPILNFGVYLLNE